jgi:acylphosphatase
MSGSSRRLLLAKVYDNFLNHHHLAEAISDYAWGSSMNKGQETAKARARVIVSGRVQGVFFRYTTREVASSLGLFGWVKNRWDGKVEAVFEGERKRVEQMIQWCDKGPPGAYVQHIETQWEEYLGEFDRFSISY